MTSPRLFLALAAMLIATGVTTAVDAAPKRHELIEPIQPAGRQQKREAAPAACYCWTEHRTNAAGLKTWKEVCSPVKPARSAKARPAAACRGKAPLQHK